MTDRPTLEGRAAVVTGGGKGLGRALCRELASHGMRVVVADVDEPAGEAVAAQLRAKGCDARCVPTDVADAASVERLAAEARAFLGPVDLLINNAGIVRMSEIAKMSLADWEAIVGVNLWGVIHGLRAFLPGMVAGSGWRHICTVTSMGALRAVRANGAYCMTKCGVHALLDVLRLEVADQGIGISLVPAGKMETSILEGMDLDQLIALSGGAAGPDRPDSKQPEEVARLVVEGILEGRFFIVTHPETAPQVLPRIEELCAAFGV